MTQASFKQLTCQVCTKQFIGRSGLRSCSKPCRSKLASKIYNDTTQRRSCAVCGRARPRQTKRFTCSDECAQVFSSGKTHHRSVLSELSTCLTCPTLFRSKHKSKHCDTCRPLHMKSRTKEKSREFSLKKYGLTLVSFQRLRDLQGNLCRICSTLMVGTGTQSNAPVVDHCHVTNKVRGILCARCNLNLGFVENLEYLRKAVTYLNLTATDLF